MNFRSLFITLLLFPCLDFSKPRVSIISFIDELTSFDQIIANVSNQTCCLELELLFVDTGVIDCGPGKAYEKLSSRIRVISFDHTLPKSEHLNCILEYCQGDFIMMLAPGDTLNSTIIEDYLKSFDADRSLDVVYANTFARYEPYARFENPPGWYWINKSDFSVKNLYYNCVGRQCMWRKSLHVRFGLFNTDYHFFYFLEFWNRIASSGANFKKIDATSGICYIPYGTHKKLFNSFEQNEKGYKEIKTIQQTYSSLWQPEIKKYAEDKSFVIVTASYKNAEWYKRNLDSIFNQKYTNYRIIYIDDASPDRTGPLVQEYIKECGMEDKVIFIQNDLRQGCPLANIHKATFMCKPHEIIVIVDGDDWLTHDNVLNRLNEIYQDPEVWCTYGQFIWFPFEVEGFAFATDESVIAHNSIRSAAWNITHLRTYYASLYHKIAFEDLLYEGRFYPMAGDLAIMYPIMEMAGKHAKFVPDVIYYYNAENVLNENKVNIELQGKCGHHVLCKPAYQPLLKLW